MIATLLIYFKCLKKHKQTRRSIELNPLETRGGQNNETRESLTPNYTDAASIETHETDKEKDCISDNEIESTCSRYSSIAHGESAHSAGYNFYMNTFIEINASRSTICSSDSRLQETVSEITQKLDIKRTSDNSQPSDIEHLTYDEYMERFIQINASSTSSESFASSAETL